MDEKKKHGFATWDTDKHRAAAKKGGLVAQASGRGHRFTPEEARAAARKGIEKRRSKRQANSTAGSS